MGKESKRVGEVGEQFDEASGRVARSPWIERLARCGYAAKGVVYIVAGALAVLAALGEGGEVTDARGAMRSIARQPFGGAMLGVVAFGLLAYVLWRWVQAITDADGKGRELKGVALRAGYFGSGVVYAGLSVSAARILFGAYNDGEPSAAQSWTARVMSLPLGAWLVSLAGLAVIGFGVYQLYKAYSAKFRKRLKLSDMSERARKMATLSGRVGYAARGTIFIVVGVLLMRAARTYNPAHARGLDGALQLLARTPFGHYLLLAVAAGLAAYGGYTLVEARYRRIAGS
ncbi:MAG: DUF1206 domain-containing protein [Acidobacteria bacterium]|nr:DUF1206 domain-containing protein [Acidobacteriota bacterium]